MTEIVTDAVLTIRRDKQPIDLFMIETMVMQHKTDSETKLIKGIVPKKKKKKLNNRNER